MRIKLVRRVGRLIDDFRVTRPRTPSEDLFYLSSQVWVGLNIKLFNALCMVQS